MTLSLQTLLGLYAMVPLAGILALWLYDEWRTRQAHFIPTRNVMITCDICLHQHFCDKDAVIVKCPQCGSLNKHVSV
jgi:hypothetical protein